MRVKVGVIFRGEPLIKPLDAGSSRVDEVFDNHLRELVYQKMSDKLQFVDAPSPFGSGPG